MQGKWASLPAPECYNSHPVRAPSAVPLLPSWCASIQPRQRCYRRQASVMSAAAATPSSRAISSPSASAAAVYCPRRRSPASMPAASRSVVSRCTAGGGASRCGGRVGDGRANRAREQGETSYERVGKPGMQHQQGRQHWLKRQRTWEPGRPQPAPLHQVCPKGLVAGGHARDHQRRLACSQQGTAAKEADDRAARQRARGYRPLPNRLPLPPASSAACTVPAPP